MEILRIQEKKGANYCLLELVGVIDSYNFTDLQRKAFNSIKDTNLVLDMAEIISMDSSGISVVLGSFNIGEEYGHKLYLMRPSAGAKKALESTGFMDSFSIIQTVTEVL